MNVRLGFIRVFNIELLFYFRTFFSRMKIERRYAGELLPGVAVNSEDGIVAI